VPKRHAVISSTNGAETATAAQTGRIGAHFAQPLQQSVAAQRVADDRQRRSRFPPPQPVHHMGNIAGVAGAITPRQPIGLTAAAAKMHDHAAPTVTRDRRQQAENVVRIAGAFQPMQNDRERSLVAGGPVQIQEVAIGQFQPFAAQAQARSPPTQRRPQGLGMGAGQPPGRAKIMRLDHAGVADG
jgi:hypothetical protein